jgi:hypothetical protein
MLITNGGHLTKQGVLMSTLGIIHNFIQMKTKGAADHRGIDIVVAERFRAEFKRTGIARLNDFQVINDGNPQYANEFPRAAVAELYDKVLYRYKEEKADAANANKIMDAAEADTGPVITAVNGIVIDEIISHGDKCQVRVHSEKPNEEVTRIVNEIMSVKARATLELKLQMHRCDDQVKIGTLDMSPGSNNLYVYTTSDDVELVVGSVPKSVLVKTLWFLAGVHRLSPSYRKFLTVTVTEGRYTCGYKEGQWFFNTDGLTELEINVSKDLQVIA